MLDEIWNLYQQYQIGQLDQKLDRVNDDAAAGAANVRAAMQLNEKVDRLALLCRAMFELMEQTSGVTEEQLKAKVAEIGGRTPPQPTPCPKCGAMISPQFGRCLFCGYGG